MIEFEYGEFTDPSGLPVFINVLTSDDISGQKFHLGEITFSYHTEKYLFYPTLDQEFAYEPYDMGLIGKKLLDLTEEYKARQEELPF